MNRFNYDYTAPYVALAPKGKHLRKQEKRREWQLLVGLAFILLCAAGAASFSTRDAYALETPNPKQWKPLHGKGL